MAFSSFDGIDRSLALAGGFPLSTSDFAWPENPKRLAEMRASSLFRISSPNALGMVGERLDPTT